jgi:molybdopterin-guanine dinucleotide biosynthesis protein A
MPAPPPSRAEAPLGAVLAGGRARRLGGLKMTRALAGRPLVLYAVEALAAVVPEVVVVAKRTTELPPLPVAVWIEPDEPQHPLAGVAWALAEAGGRPVLVLAGDMPRVPPALLATLAADAGDAPAVVVRGPDSLEPLAALYRPAALAPLRRAAAAAAPAREAVTALAPSFVDWHDAGALRSVNTLAELGVTQT